MTMLRRILLPLGILFSLFFSALWALSWMNAAWVEKHAVSFVRGQVESEVSARIAALDENSLAGNARRWLESHSAEIATARRWVNDNLSDQVAAVVTQIQTGKATNADDEAATGRWPALTRMKDKLRTLIHTQYVAVTEKLLREFRIFTGVNAAIFIAFTLLLALRRDRMSVLRVPALLLLPTVAIAIYGYLFAQNWLYTLLFNDYVGYAYLGWSAVILLFFMDIELNDADVTEAIVDVVSSSLSAVTGG